MRRFLSLSLVCLLWFHACGACFAAAKSTLAKASKLTQAAFARLDQTTVRDSEHISPADLIIMKANGLGKAADAINIAKLGIEAQHAANVCRQTKNLNDYRIAYEKATAVAEAAKAFSKEYSVEYGNIIAESFLEAASAWKKLALKQIGKNPQKGSKEATVLKKIKAFAKKHPVITTVAVVATVAAVVAVSVAVPLAVNSADRARRDNNQRKLVNDIAAVNLLKQLSTPPVKAPEPVKSGIE